jgi:hypothetical protein
MTVTITNPPPLRSSLQTAINIARSRIGATGTWLTGAMRVAIAAETRQAKLCLLCQARKKALSPMTVHGDHDHLGELSATMVDVVHRLVTDSGRLSEKWVQEKIAEGLAEEEYVEIIGVVATQVGLDTLNHALGAGPDILHEAQVGEPDRRRPSGARKDLAWVSTLSAETIEDDDPQIFAMHGKVNIHRAISLVPQEAINFFDLDVELYLKDHEIRDFDHEFRAISHAQIELIAGRTSALNACYY